MALIKCPQCGKEISDKATNCIGCGWKVQSKQYPKKRKLKYIITENRKKRFPSTSSFIIMVMVLTMICFMIIVWKRLDKFSEEIDLITSNMSFESGITTSNTDKEVEKNIEDVEDQKNIEEDSEVEEISDNVQNINSPENNVEIVENANINFEYTDYKIQYGYVCIYIKISNNMDTPIFISPQRFHYLNDVSIEKAYFELDKEILSGKSSLLEIGFNVDKLKAAEIVAIDSFTFRYDTAENADSEDLSSGEITFKGLGININ